MFVNREGQRVPEVSFAERDAAGNWKKVTTADLFAGKTVVLFALPGAFTPTCSSAHVPRYNELYDNFKAAGVDDLLCLSVNDTFVMNAWQHEQGADRITFVPDGNGTFTEGMGLLVGKDQLGFGKRSWRYSMLVRDGVIEKMFIEEDVPGDPFLVSDADTMLAYLNAPAAPDVLMYLPLGVAVVWLRPRSVRLVAMAVVLMVPLFVELAQKELIAINRQCSLSDIIGNEVGLVVGMAVGSVLLLGWLVMSPRRSSRTPVPRHAQPPFPRPPFPGPPRTGTQPRRPAASESAREEIPTRS